MLRLRKQVDRIDQRLLRLLQQRTKLSGEIGRTKRKHGAEIYVPDRERDLLARVAKLAGGKLPPAAVGAIFREILSSSRAAQGQPPIGVLKRSAAAILPAARCHFGACDRFVTVAGWRELKKQLLAGKLAIGLLGFADLAFLRNETRGTFPARLQVVGEMIVSPEAAALRDRVFIVKPSASGPAGQYALILIECKPAADAVKSILRAMPSRLVKQIDAAGFPSGRGAGLLGLRFARTVREEEVVIGADVKASLLGIFSVSETYGR